jgi:hypothetical protein
MRHEVIFLWFAACGVGCIRGEPGRSDNADASPAAPIASPGASTASLRPRATVSPDDSDVGLCSSLCARSEGLHCAAAGTCVERCQKMQAFPGCQASVRAMLGCFLSAPTTAWACNDHGLPSLRGTMCDTEQARAAKCISAGPQLPQK